MTRAKVFVHLAAANGHHTAATPAFLNPEGVALPRHALATTEPFRYHAPYVRLRVLQAQQRVAAFDAEKPENELVIQATVKSKKVRTARFVARLTELGDLQKSLRDLLDRIVRLLVC